MNTTAQALIFAVVSVAGAAAIGLALADHTARSSTEIVRLETVVIEGHRSHADSQVSLQIEVLPRVVIEGRATQAANQQVAAAAAPRARSI